MPPSEDVYTGTDKPPLPSPFLPFSPFRLLLLLLPLLPPSTSRPPSHRYAMNSLLRPVMVQDTVQDTPQDTPSPGHAAPDAAPLPPARPRVYAHRSLEEHAIHAIREASVPLLVLYGDKDWLYDPQVNAMSTLLPPRKTAPTADHISSPSSSSYSSASSLSFTADTTDTDNTAAAADNTADAADNTAEWGIRLETVPSSGHHLYMDNPAAFNGLVLDFIKHTEQHNT